jgi:glycosyltransferase involved in cell wall biosynthesis
MYKILKIAPTPFFADRGCHVRILEESRVLQARGHRIRVCTYHIGRDLPDVKTERIIDIPWYKKLDAGPSWHKYYLDILLALKSLWIAMKDRPDVIHAHLHEGVFVGYFISRILGVPLLFDLQGSLVGEMMAHEFISDRGIFFRFNRFLERVTNGLPDVIMASSVGAANFLKSQPSINGKKIHVIPEGVDCRLYDNVEGIDELRAEIGIPKSSVVVIYLGLLYHYQGIDSLLEVIPTIISQVPDVHFLVIGFPNADYYKRIATERGLADWTSFVGRVDYAELPRYLALGDVAVTPKDSETEANSKIYNFMAAGLPVVAYDTPTNRQILGDLGVYARLRDKKDLARVLVDLVKDKKRMEDLGRQVKQRAAEQFSWDAVGLRIERIYDSLTKWRTGRAAQVQARTRV